MVCVRLIIIYQLFSYTCCEGSAIAVINLGDTPNGGQQVHNGPLGRSQLHDRHQILAAGPDKKGTQNFIRALHEDREVFTTRSVAPGKPVLHSLLIRPGPAGHDLYARAASPGRSAQRSSDLASETASMKPWRASRGNLRGYRRA